MRWRAMNETDFILITSDGIDWRNSGRDDSKNFLGKRAVSAPTLYGIWPRLSRNIKMQIKGLHLVICVLVHLVKSWSWRCAVTRTVRYAAIETPLSSIERSAFTFRSSSSRLSQRQVAHEVPVVRRHRGDDS